MAVPAWQQPVVKMLADLTQLAVMGVSQAVTNLPSFYRLFSQGGTVPCPNTSRCRDPDRLPGLQLVDCARRQENTEFPSSTMVCPKCGPGLGWRVRKLRRLVDHVLCKLPFEVDWFQQRGCAATYVGHPFF